MLALSAGLAVGYAKHGRLRRLATPPPVRNRLLLTALGLYILGVFASWAWESALGVLSALSWLVVAFYAWINRWMPGARLIAFGLAANALVLLFNGSIPVSPNAASRAGAEPSAVTSAEHTEPVDESTRLSILTKNIPVAFPPRPEVVSPGDIAVAAGLAVVVATGMTGHRPTSPTPPAPRRRNPYAAQLDERPEGEHPPDAHTDAEPHHDPAPRRPGAAAPDHGRRPSPTRTGEPAHQHSRATMKGQRPSDTTPIRRQPVHSDT
ncbi:DUF5317 family protein [Phytoactinopolyspora limicola]|uniref:DUF5317 family protein n=1 Tax=Phytoactinopolyspora limicola TaxID=2715536 RepID=UPI00140CD0C7|nr:DUF5317 family protein [Phytoactinopolyspora limicola]